MAGRRRRQPRADLLLRPRPCQVKQALRGHRANAAGSAAAADLADGAQALAQGRERVRHPLRPLPLAGRPSRLFRAEPRSDQVTRPALAVAGSDLSERARRGGRQFLDAERAQQHRGGLRVGHRIRRPQRRVQEPGVAVLRRRRPAAHGGFPERRERRRGGLCAGDVARRCLRRELLEGPGGRGFRAVGKGLRSRPHDDRRPVIPAVKRVAPAPHVPLVLRFAGRELIRRGGRAHLADTHPQQGLFQPAAVRPGPVGKGDLRVDQLLNLVLATAVVRFAGEIAIVVGLVVIAVIPALVLVIAREGAVLRLQIRQLGDGRRVAVGAAGVAVHEQVVGERDPVAGHHLEHFVSAVGVEGDGGKRPFRSPVSLPLLAAPHHQLAAGVVGWQRYHQGADHRVVLLGILVGEEELARLVDQERVQVGGQRGGVRKAQLFLGSSEHILQRRVAPRGADQVLRDLPGIADLGVGQRLGAPPEPGGLAETNQLARLRRGYRKLDAPEPRNRQAQVVRRRRHLDA